MLTEEKQKAIRVLKTARGQIDGIIKMIEDDTYCIDVSNQIMANIALIKKANFYILKGHLMHCVENASEEKLQELTSVLERLSK